MKSIRLLFSTSRIFIAIVITLLMFFPLYWMLITSLKPLSEISSAVPTLWPQTFVWSNFKEAFEAAPFATYTMNTVIKTIGILIIKLNVDILAAYAFAKGNFKGRDTLFIIVLVALMIPNEVTFIPVYVMMSKLGWIDTYWGLIVPSAVSAYGIFLLRQAFKSINSDVIEAAKIDGANRFQIIYGIMVPMARPTVITLAIFIVIGSWNAYFWPLIVTNSENMRVLTMGIVMLKQAFPGTEVANWNIIMAASAITMAPIVILFVIAQKYIMKAMANNTFK
ncbi:carbohydrate ABC transporter permease [Alkalihalobacillus sp. BA299]|uniref:carbohydrate ABC transporter permease n=1 Tax=Alkalihalobacillus sp. BA299 TaxID=2815938 RepID=UPI001ADC8B10|nr:carbohydrate ABC transporter permease [Alkalihalobacillus sp. BA299]